MTLLKESGVLGRWLSNKSACCASKGTEFKSPVAMWKSQSGQVCPLWGVETGGLQGVLTASLALGSVSDCLKGIQHSDRAEHLMTSSGTCHHNPKTNTVCHILTDPTHRLHTLPHTVKLREAYIYFYPNQNRKAYMKKITGLTPHCLFLESGVMHCFQSSLIAKH